MEPAHYIQHIAIGSDGWQQRPLPSLPAEDWIHNREAGSATSRAPSPPGRSAAGTERRSIYPTVRDRPPRISPTCVSVPAIPARRISPSGAPWTLSPEPKARSQAACTTIVISKLITMATFPRGAAPCLSSILQPGPCTYGLPQGRAAPDVARREAEGDPDEEGSSIGTRKADHVSFPRLIEGRRYQP